MNEWITDWNQIKDDTRYLVCPINARSDGSLYLAHPIAFRDGWEVRRLIERCYAALEVPEFKGVETKERDQEH